MEPGVGGLGLDGQLAEASFEGARSLDGRAEFGGELEALIFQGGDAPILVANHLQEQGEVGIGRGCLALHAAYGDVITEQPSGGEGGRGEADLGSLSLAKQTNRDVALVDPTAKDSTRYTGKRRRVGQREERDGGRPRGGTGFAHEPDDSTRDGRSSLAHGAVIAAKPSVRSTRHWGAWLGDARRRTATRLTNLTTEEARTHEEC